MFSSNGSTPCSRNMFWRELDSFVCVAEFLSILRRKFHPFIPSYPYGRTARAAVTEIQQFFSSSFDCGNPELFPVLPLFGGTFMKDRYSWLQSQRLKFSNECAQPFVDVTPARFHVPT